MLINSIIVNGNNNVKIDENKEVTVFGFGSCNRHDLPQPAWKNIAKHNPNLFLWLGDVIYGDDMIFPAVWRPAYNMTLLRQKYDAQKNNNDYNDFVSKFPIIGTWDDHDYGNNDGGFDYTEKANTKIEFLNFINVPKDSPVYKREGIYQSYTFGPKGRRIKFILLDVRSFRTKTDPLGEDQWKWLTKEFSESDAQINFIGSGTQVIPSDKPFIEKWADFSPKKLSVESLISAFKSSSLSSTTTSSPDPLTRLYQLIKSTKVQGAILLSGDVHHSEILRTNCSEIGYPLYEITSSGLTHSINSQVPILGDFLLHTFLRSKYTIFADSKENFGIIKINWETSEITISLYGAHGNQLATHKVSISEIHHSPNKNNINKEDCSFDPGFLQWKLIPKKIALILGFVVGGAVVLVLFVVVGYFCRSKKTEKKLHNKKKAKKE